VTREHAGGATWQASNGDIDHDVRQVGKIGQVLPVMRRFVWPHLILLGRRLTDPDPRGLQYRQSDATNRNVKHLEYYRFSRRVWHVTIPLQR
jgi:hypothetical protein